MTARGKQPHDYVVVGAGSAGCIVARRLSDDPKTRVLLIEAGPPKRDSIWMRAPGLFIQLMRSPVDWQFRTEPQAHVDGRRMFWPRGKVVGGTGSINAMLYVRGHRDNYDEWRDLGNEGWGYSDVLPYFKQSEANVRGSSEFHGGDGLLAVSDPHGLSDVTRAFVEAAARCCSVPLNDDFNGAEQEGAGIYQVTTRDRRRASTATDFLDPVRERANLEVVTGALVAAIDVDKGRANAVRYVVDGREAVASAAREIILCAGTIGSPHILLRSGIGPASELRAAGVSVVHDLPGVGKNLQDHLAATVTYHTSARAFPRSTLPSFAKRAAAYALARRGELAIPVFQVGAFVRSGTHTPRPDVQYIFSRWGGTEPNIDEARPPSRGRAFAIHSALLYPRSVGELRLASKDPGHPPAIDPRYFAEDADLEHLVRAVRQSREIAATRPLSTFAERERWPGPGHDSDEALRASIRRGVNTMFHPVGTCKMGTDAMAVVGPDLRVRGVDGLRVADASIMPRIVGGNTNAPTMMIAEKAARMIRG